VFYPLRSAISLASVFVMAKSKFSKAVSSRLSDLRLVSRPSTLVDSGDDCVLVPRELVFSAPCPWDGLPCAAWNVCFSDSLDSVDRHVVLSRCARFGVR